MGVKLVGRGGRRRLGLRTCQAEYGAACDSARDRAGVEMIFWSRGRGVVETDDGASCCCEGRREFFQESGFKGANGEWVKEG